MTKVFKAGDKVKRIKNNNWTYRGMVVGNVYTFKEYADKGREIKVEEVENSWIASNFELVEEPIPFGKQLFGYKIRVKDEEQSRLIQEAVFEAGGSWFSGEIIPKQYISECPHLIDEDGLMSIISTNVNTRFEKCELPELVLETVKSLRIVETIPVKSQADKEKLQQTIDKLQQDLQNAQQQLNNIGGN